MDELELNIETPSIWNKTPNELTVSEELKLTATYTAVMVAVCALGYGALVGWDKFTKRRQAKKDRVSTTVENA